MTQNGSKTNLKVSLSKATVASGIAGQKQITLIRNSIACNAIINSSAQRNKQKLSATSQEKKSDLLVLKKELSEGYNIYSILQENEPKRV